MSAKTILVTGGNRSIGFGIVQRLAQRSSSNNIIIASRQKDHAEKSILELQSMGFKSSFHAISLELTDDDSIRKAVAEVDQKFGKLDGMKVRFDRCQVTDNDFSPHQQRWYSSSRRRATRLPCRLDRSLQRQRLLRSCYLGTVFTSAA